MKTYVNPNREEADAIRKKIKDNDGYCPCRVVKNEFTKCPCKIFRDQEIEGWCHCGLYYKAE